MKQPEYYIEGTPVYRYNTVVIGSGAAALASADSLYRQNVTDIAIVTEGMNMGTSRNTGSDKQTYYKLSTCAEKADSAYDMANDLFACGSMHGDIALVEAVTSLRAFYKLVSIGVPFPHSPLGEYTGYRTDHDSRSRATSCGPLTSKFMTEALETQVMANGTDIFDNCRVISLLSEKQASDKPNIIRGAVGLLTSPDGKKAEMLVFDAENVIFAVGGPSSVYKKTVYPESQTCSLGMAMKAGASAVNLTESQYGLASLKFRWNLSGSYQQVIPRYISTNAEGGDEREFLLDYFTPSEAADAVFHKGYEWPFDAAKLTSGARSSRVDLAVFIESMKGRRTFLDFRRDPVGLTPNSPQKSEIGEPAYDYLSRSNALSGSPIDRLISLNERAYQLYLDHGIDLKNELLEIGVCAQHCNGGLEGDTNYESSTVEGLYIVGEANGVFGVKRPGGTALNSTQVGAIRASEHIAAKSPSNRARLNEDILADARRLYSLMKPNGMKRGEILAIRENGGAVMDRGGAFLRGKEASRAALETVSGELDRFFAESSAEDGAALVELCINYDTLLTRKTMLSAIAEYIEHGGLSRGSYVISSLTPDELIRSEDPSGDDSTHSALVLRTFIADNGDTLHEWVPVRPIPHEDNWFEDLLAKSKI